MVSFPQISPPNPCIYPIRATYLAHLTKRRLLSAASCRRALTAVCLRKNWLRTAAFAAHQDKTQRNVDTAEFEPTISAGERPKTYALDRAATATGKHSGMHSIELIWKYKLIYTDDTPRKCKRKTYRFKGDVTFSNRKGCLKLILEFQVTIRNITVAQKGVHHAILFHVLFETDVL